jgi:hypothetical protein
MQELFKRANLWNHGQQRGRRGTSKGTNIFNKTIAENSPNFEREIPIQLHEASRTPDLAKIEPLYSILWLKQLAQRTRREY